MLVKLQRISEPELAGVTTGDGGDEDPGEDGLGKLGYRAAEQGSDRNEIQIYLVGKQDSQIRSTRYVQYDCTSVLCTVIECDYARI